MGVFAIAQEHGCYTFTRSVPQSGGPPASAATGRKIVSRSDSS